MPNLFVDLDDFVPGGAGGLDDGDVVPARDYAQDYAPGGCYHVSRAPELVADIRAAAAAGHAYIQRLNRPEPHRRSLEDVVWCFAGVGVGTELGAAIYADLIANPLQVR
jgi:hypothetical protein